MDPELEAFERARTNRETRTDPSTHTFVVQKKLVPKRNFLGRVVLDPKTGEPQMEEIDGPVVPAPDSPHRDRLRPMGTPAAPGARHEGVAADLARAYVDAHPELETIYGGLGVDQLVTAVDMARLAGNEEKRVQIDAWLMAKFAPFNVSGVHTGTEAD